jgi:hypothetical protein
MLDEKCFPGTKAGQKANAPFCPLKANAPLGMFLYDSDDVV